jgi:hypothetical protein
MPPLNTDGPAGNMSTDIKDDRWHRTRIGAPRSADPADDTTQWKRLDRPNFHRLASIQSRKSDRTGAFRRTSAIEALNGTAQTDVADAPRAAIQHRDSADFALGRQAIARTRADLALVGDMRRCCG